MNLINKIKNLFKEKKEELTGKISLNEIDLWIKEREDKINNSLKEKSNSFYSEIESIITKLESDVKTLNSLDLSNKKTNEKIKQITETGRINFTEALEKLIEKLKEQKKEPDPILIKTEINKFQQSSAKSHLRATQLIGKEIEVLTDGIVRIKSLIEDFIKENSELIKSKYSLNNISEKNKLRNKNEETRTEITSKIKELCDKNKNYENNLLEIKKELKRINDSQEYKERENLLTEKNKKESLIKERESKLNEHIDKKILEKYFYINKEDNKLAREYIENPANALLLDEELKIIEIIKDIKEKIKNNSLTIKEPERTIKKMNIEKKDLINLKNEIILLKEEINKTEERITNIKLDPSQLLVEKTRLENKIIENTKILEILNKKQDKLNKEIESLSSEILLNINESKKL